MWVALEALQHFEAVSSPARCRPAGGILNIFPLLQYIGLPSHEINKLDYIYRLSHFAKKLLNFTTD